MAKRHHTIILIPHAHAKLRKWRVTNLQIGIAAGAFLLLTLAAALFIWLHFSTNVNPVEIARLKRENEQLRKTNLTFESSVKQAAEPAQRVRGPHPPARHRGRRREAGRAAPRRASAAARRSRGRRRRPARRMREPGGPARRHSRRGRGQARRAGALDLLHPGDRAGQGDLHQRLRRPRRSADPRPRRPPGGRHRGAPRASRCTPAPTASCDRAGDDRRPRPGGLPRPRLRRHHPLRPHVAHRRCGRASG